MTNMRKYELTDFKIEVIKFLLKNDKPPRIEHLFLKDLLD